ncbi:MAG: hypothetical protein M3Z30_05565 [Gemmatimonadota bacterium]|nr:hypothetical protein [Gemmatimonadota bacterium]
MFLHRGHISRAEVTEPRVVCLGLVVFEGSQESPMLKDRVVDLLLQEVVTMIHLPSPLRL